jgi:hypothetical protein
MVIRVYFEVNIKYFNLLDYVLITNNKKNQFLRFCCKIHSLKNVASGIRGPETFIVDPPLV